jgi:phenylalanyl-tRNA synthetase alpha subunit
MGDNLDRRWTKMLEMEKKSKETEQKTLEKCIPATVDREGNRHPIRLITSEYLQEQANLQFEFYTNYK